MTVTGDGQIIRNPPTGGGGGGGDCVSGRIFGDEMTQLAGSGYAWAGTSGAQYWDDAGYWQPYGSRSEGALDPAAIVAIVPVSGRYRYHCWVIGGWIAPAVGIANTHLYAIWERNSGGPQSSFDISPSPRLMSGDDTGMEITVELFLNAGGMIGMSSIFSSSPGFDVVDRGYQYIELLCEADPPSCG